MLHVYLIPGFLASNLGVLSSGQKLWWDTNLVTLVGIGGLRLDPAGTGPGPPDGLQMAVDTVPQPPWGNIEGNLQAQLDPAKWLVEVGPYDWRLDLSTPATSLANNIRARSTVAEPATIVGHSAGGIVAVLAWANLVGTGQQNLVRRIISIVTPFQGSYAPQQWLGGISASVQQMIAMANSTGTGVGGLANWSLRFLNALACTWPAFYQLMPSLEGSEAEKDPNRDLLFLAGNYGGNAFPSQPWLTAALNSFQPFMQTPATFPPDYVMTCVVPSGLETASRLLGPQVPLNLVDFGTTDAGDGIVTEGSATRSPGKVVQVCGGHASIPLAITDSGLLASLILDPRGPLSPPPPPVVVPGALPINTNDPPLADPISGLVCIGGHC